MVMSLRRTLVIGLTLTLLLAPGLVSGQSSPFPFSSFPFSFLFSFSRSFLYHVHNLVSDGSVPADHVDPDLVNPWGIAFNPFEPGFVWVADNETGKSTLYDGNGVKQGLVVTIQGGKPTGIVFSGASAAFVVSGSPARFIFATENGTIDAWAPPATGSTAVTKFTKAGAIYKGLAIGANGTAFQLYAADFFNRRVDIYDATFTPVVMPDAFVDLSVPSDFAPFGIQNIGGDIWVTYAKRNEEGDDDVAGRGLGFVNVFTPNGRLIRRVVSHIGLNAPWGLAIAPANFGLFSNRLLVGNFGDGTISAYDPGTGFFLGKLLGQNFQPLVIEGLWGIAFGNGLRNQPTNVLFFAAGPEDEEHGVYGKIEPIP
jgi:uncharacterized protein (TIGR03118 family)